MARKNLSIFVVMLLLGSFFGCSREPENKSPQFGVKSPNSKIHNYHLAVHPLHNPAKLIQAYQPLLDYINNRLPEARMNLEASRDYANFEEKLRAREPEFILPNPWQTLQAIKAGYRVIAMAGEPQDFKGIFIVRKDSGIINPVDIKAQAVSYPSRTALAACIMPQYFLYNHGININQDIQNQYVGSQESSIMNVYLKLTVAGATWPPPWRAFQKDHPREAAELKIIWETQSLINNSFMVRSDIPLAEAEQIQTLLLSLHKSMEGKSILAGMETARFFPATDQDYNVVREYIKNFERDVRPVEKK